MLSPVLLPISCILPSPPCPASFLRLSLSRVVSCVCRQFTLCCARLADLCGKGLETSVAEFTAYRLLHALYKKHFHQVTNRYTQMKPLLLKETSHSFSSTIHP